MTTTTVPEIAEDESVTARIKHILEIFPIVSPTMLQGALGPKIKPEDWRPILEEMVQSGIIIQDSLTRKSPANYHNTYQRIMLAETSELLKSIA